MGKYEKKRPGGGKNIIILSAVVLMTLAALIGAVIYKEKEQAEYLREVQEAEQKEKALGRILIGNTILQEDVGGFIDAFEVLNKQAEGIIVLSPEQFKEKSSSMRASNTQNALAGCRIMEQVDKEDKLVLQFEAYTDEAVSIKLEAVIDKEKYSLMISDKPQMFFIPICGVTELSSISFTTSDKQATTHLEKMYLINYRQEYEYAELTTGIYNSDSYENIQIDVSSQAVPKGIQCLVKEDMIFSIAEDKLYTYRKGDNGTYIELGNIGGMGTVRDMEFTQDETAVCITAREYGMYIVDVSVPEEPRIISHYDTLDYATGIAVRGNYCFVGSRFFGVEVVDISDLNNPKFVNSIGKNRREYQDLFIDGQYLYVGVYENKSIDVWDIGDLMNPVCVSQIELDGQGQGCFVQDGILYAATGLTNSYGRNGSDVWNFNKGTGNGLEIYDVADPSEPIKLSVSKLEGRYWYNLTGIDIWDVTVANEYAYVTDMLNGVWVYNVSDLRHPVCETVYTFLGENDAGVSPIDLSNYVINFDQEMENRDFAHHTICCDGEIFVTTQYNGVYAIEDSRSHKTILPAIAEYECKKPEDDTIELNFYNCQHYQDNNCIWAAVANDNYIYLAAGEEGILVLDYELNLVASYACDASVRDVKLAGDILYTAETTAGIGVYRVNGSELSKVSSFEVDSARNCATQLGIGGDGKFLLVKLSVSKYMVLSTEDPYYLTELQFEGQNNMDMSYARTITDSPLLSGWIGISGLDEQHWYALADGEPSLVARTPTPRWKEENGISTSKNWVIMMVDEGYYYYDPSRPEDVTAKTIGVPVNGKSASNDSILVASGSMNGNIAILNIENIANPVVMEQFEINGNPDVAYIGDEMILIPCRYYGLLKLTSKS